jgi:hypothetical protein
MNRLGGTQTAKGIGAGFIATIVLSALMVMKQRMDVMPQLNPIEMITQMMGRTSRPLGGLFTSSLVRSFGVPSTHGSIQACVGLIGSAAPYLRRALGSL